MNSLFEAYVTADESDSGRGIYLDLPAAPEVLQEVTDRLRLPAGKNMQATVTLCSFSPVLSELLQGQHDLYELDVLARQIAQMDDHAAEMFHALLCMEKDRTSKESSVSRLLTLAGCTDSCQVIPNVRDDAALGRLRRREEGGVFTSAGYVTCPQEVLENARLAASKPLEHGVTVLLQMEDGSRYQLPADGQLPKGAFRCLACAATAMTDAISACGDIALVQQLAKTLAELSPQQLRVCQAAAAATGCPDMRQALFVARHPAQFYVYPDIRTPEDVVRSELAVFVNRDIAEKMLPYLDMQRYGESILKEHNAALTDYGLVERVQYEPLCSARVVLSDDECPAPAYGPMTQQM